MYAVTHRHVGASSSSPDGRLPISGHVITGDAPSTLLPLALRAIRRMHDVPTVKRHIAHFEISPVRDIIMWEHLVQDSISIHPLHHPATESPDKRFVLSGSKLDVADYEPGVVLVVPDAAWNSITSTKSRQGTHSNQDAVGLGDNRVERNALRSPNHARAHEIVSVTARRSGHVELLLREVPLHTAVQNMRFILSTMEHAVHEVPPALHINPRNAQFVTNARGSCGVDSTFLSTVCSIEVAGDILRREADLSFVENATGKFAVNITGSVFGVFDMAKSVLNTTMFMNANISVDINCTGRCKLARRDATDEISLLNFINDFRTRGGFPIPMIGVIRVDSSLKFPYSAWFDIDAVFSGRYEQSYSFNTSLADALALRADKPRVSDVSVAENPATGLKKVRGVLKTDAQLKVRLQVPGMLVTNRATGTVGFRIKTKGRDVYKGYEGADGACGVRHEWEAVIKPIMNNFEGVYDSSPNFGFEPRTENVTNAVKDSTLRVCAMPVA